MVNTVGGWGRWRPARVWLTGGEGWGLVEDRWVGQLGSWEGGH